MVKGPQVIILVMVQKQDASLISYILNDKKTAFSDQTYT